MSNLWRALFSALLVLTLLQTTNCGKFGGRSGGRHSYPSSGGLSGSRSSGGSHGYPSSGGLSGSRSGGSHGYPSSGGLSGSNTGSHSYPSNNGGSHGYPSGGMSGSNSGGSHGYPSGGSSVSRTGGSHAYPTSGGMSGAGSGSKPGYPGYTSPPRAGNTHTTHITNNHYHYTPPQQIRYASPGQAAHSYPVYQGSPPNYVYQYKDSGSKYGTLLAGLALLNLGTLGASVYAASKAGSGSGSGGSGGGYVPQKGEYCKFGIKKDNGDYEETRIDCNLISSFIYQEEAKPQQTGGTNSVVTTVTNVTVVNMTNGVTDAPQTTAAPLVFFQQLPDGSLVRTNITVPLAGAVNATVNGTNTTGNSSSVVTTITSTTTTTNTTSALDVKGDPIKVTPGMQCFVIRHAPDRNMKKTVPCGLLQSYADQSIKRNSAARNIPTFTVLCAVIAFMAY